jgi:hypothetical protein
MSERQAVSATYKASPRERALDACLWVLVMRIRSGEPIKHDGYLMRRADELLLEGIPLDEREEKVA